jgi:hypothetical protein
MPLGRIRQLVHPNQSFIDKASVTTASEVAAVGQHTLMGRKVRRRMRECHVWSPGAVVRQV